MKTIASLLPSRRSVESLFITFLLFASTAGLATSAEARKSFDLPAGKAEETLRTFAAQSGVEIVFTISQVDGIATHAVRGELTPREALDAMLANTPLETVQDERTGALTVRRQEELGKNDESRPAGSVTARTQDGRIVLDKYEVTERKVDGLINKSLLSTAPDAPLYYNVVSREQIERLGVTSIEELFRYIPQTSSPATSLQASPGNLNVSGGTVANISRIGLRGFVQSQTVILVNGRALPRAGTFNTSGTDISRIPIAAIERIEILPTSGSALYGAGAIGGAINIILRRDYHGKDLTTYIGTSTDGGATEYRFTYLDGRTFNDGRTNLTLTLDYQHRDPLFQGDRDYINRLLRVYPPGTMKKGTGGVSAFELYTLPAFAGSPATIRINSTTGDLGIPGAPGARFAVVPAGTTWTGSTSLSPSSFTATANQFAMGNRLNRTTIYEPVDNYTINAQLEHAFVPDKFYGYGELTLRYLRKEFSYPQYGNVISLSATDPLNPFRTGVTPGFVGRAVQVYMDPIDIPDPSSLEERDNVRLVAGIRGKMSKGWEWSFDATGDYNHTVASSNNRPNLLGSLLSATLSSSYPDAAPLDVRRAVYPILADHTKYPIPASDVDKYWDSIRYSSSYTGSVDTIARLTGPILHLPAGEVMSSMLAQGTYFQYRGGQNITYSDATRGLFSSSGSFSNYDSTDNTPEYTRTTYAGAVELVAPIIGRDWRPLPVDLVELNLSGRYELADSYGENFNQGPTFDYNKAATTTVVGLKVQVVRDIAFRGSYTEGFYPPDWNEIGQPVAPYSYPGIIPDPLRGNTTQGDPMLIVNGGNPALRPEQSESKNFGMIFTPRFIPGFTLTVDYWKTDKVDAIARIIFVNAIARASEYAYLIKRADPTPAEAAMGWAGKITEFNQTTQNIGLQTTEGFDIQARYDHEYGSLGRLFFTANSSFTDHFAQRQTANSPLVDLAGGSGPVRWRGYASLSWQKDRYGATVTGNYVGHYSTNSTDPSPSFPTAVPIDGGRIPAFLQWDVQFTYEMPYAQDAQHGWRSWIAGTKWTLGALNIFNDEPSLVTNGTSFYNTYQDPRQRYVYLSIKKSL